MDLSNYRDNKFLYTIISREAFLLYKQLLWTMGAVMNLLMLADLKVSTGHTLDFKSSVLETIYGVLNFIMFSFSTFVFIIWMKYRYSQHHKEKMVKWRIKYPRKNPDTLGSKIDISVFESFLNIKVVSSLLTHIVVSAIEIPFRAKWLSAFHLFTIVNINNTARSVILAIFKHINQIVMTLILMIIFIFIFTVIQMTFIDESYWKYPEVKCARLYECFSYVFNLGIRWSQGIGYHFIVTNYANDHKYWYKWLYEVIFYVIINRVLMLVIFGIIVSTFGQLRGIAQKRKNDRINVCFVCGLNRETFALHGKDFDAHIEQEHDPWMY